MFLSQGLAHAGPNSTLANKCPEITRNLILLKVSLEITGVIYHDSEVVWRNVVRCMHCSVCII